MTAPIGRTSELVLHRYDTGTGWEDLGAVSEPERGGGGPVDVVIKGGNEMACVYEVVQSIRLRKHHARRGWSEETLLARHARDPAVAVFDKNKYLVAYASKDGIVVTSCR